MIDPKKRVLLFSVTRKDLTIQTFRSGGPGGQNQNKVESGVRIIHRDSGAVGESREERSQWANKKKAFERLAKSPKFKAWHKLRCAELMSGKPQRTIDDILNDSMDERNLKIENYTP